MALKSKSAQEAIKILGKNISIARRKRRIAVRDFANRIGVSVRTVIRLEKGDEGVKVGTLAMALLVLGEINRISELLESSDDHTGLLLDQENLPTRIRSIQNSSKQNTPIIKKNLKSLSDKEQESES